MRNPKNGPANLHRSTSFILCSIKIGGILYSCIQVLEVFDLTRKVSAEKELDNSLEMWELL